MSSKVETSSNNFVLTSDLKKSNLVLQVKMAEKVAIIGSANKKGKCWWWKNFTKFEIILIVVLAISLSISCVLMKYFFMTNNRENCFKKPSASNFTQIDADEVCDTPECVTISHQILTYVDHTIDPCHDFYKYACGGWEKKNNDGTNLKSVISTQMSEEIDQTIKGILEGDWKFPKMDMNLVLDQLRVFYHSCMYTTTVEKLGFHQATDLIKNIGKIQLEKDNSTDEFNFSKTLCKMLIIGGTPFFDVGVQIDHKNSSQLVVLISLPFYVNSFTFPHQTGSYIKESFVNSVETSTEEQVIRNATFFDYIKRYIDNEMDKKMQTALEKLFKFKNETILEINNNLKKFLNEFQNIMPKPKALKDLNDGELDVKMSVESLQKIFGLVNWKQILSILFDTEFNDNTVIEVNYPKYFKDLNNILKKFSTREINNALLALFARDTLLEIANEEADSERWKYCVNTIKNLSPATLSLVYAENIPKKVFKSIVNDANEIFEFLKKSLIIEIKESLWMSPKTTKTAIAKVTKMNGNFNEVLLSLSDPIMKNLTSVTLIKDDYFHNVIELTVKNREIARDLYKIHLSKNEIEIYFGLPKVYDLNAYYLHIFNKIVINLGIFNLPFYSINAPKYVLFGSLGMTIAHEMLHAFDTIGMKYDENGNFRNWITIEEDIVYKNISQCFINKSTTLFLQLIKSKSDLSLIENFNFDGKYTLNENMADSGITLAFKAYKLWAKTQNHIPKLPGISLSKDNVFFLSAAQTSCTILPLQNYILNLEMDEHTPEPERVNLYLMNSNEFSDIFQCHSTSQMNSRNKCLIWY